MAISPRWREVWRESGKFLYFVPRKSARCWNGILHALSSSWGPHGGLPLTQTVGDPAHPGARILIVDDNPVNLKLMRVLLTGEGYAVRTATDADEAWTMVRHFDPRLIVMDVQLPGVDGLALTRQLKADPTAGCDGYVAKPIDTRTFPSLVARYFGS